MMTNLEEHILVFTGVLYLMDFLLIGMILLVK